MSVAIGRQPHLHGSSADDVPVCASCHRPTSTGSRPDFPNLASWEPGHVEQLAVRDETRGHHGKLTSVIVPHRRPEQRRPVERGGRIDVSRPRPLPLDDSCRVRIVLGSCGSAAESSRGDLLSGG